MKKTRKMTRDGYGGHAFKILRVMKVTLLLMFIAVFEVVAADANAQSAKVSIALENKTVRDVLTDIEAQSEYSFFYNEGLIDVQREVTIVVEDEKIEDVLDDLFKGTDVTHELRGNHIILSNQSQVSSESSQQQKRTITGKVTDTNGESIPGVSVLVKGTTTGTISDFDGNFTMPNVPGNATLVFSFVGMKTQEVVVAGKTNINVALEEESVGIEEVVAVGYGVQKKSVTTAAISKVDANQILNAQPVRIENALQGKVSGVQITTNSGQPGSSSVVRIRGTGTINDSDPLYIVDGMPVKGGIDYLNPSDIESVEVLKDAASAAIYGSRAANGVILVTTKKGKAGKTIVTYNFSQGWQNPLRKVDVLNASEYETIINEALVNAGLSKLYPNPEQAGEGTDWQDAIFYNNAPKVEHQVSVSGGSEKGTYFLSFGYLDQHGIVAEGKSNYKRYNVRYNNYYSLYKNEDSRFLRSVSLGANAGYTRTLSSQVVPNDEYDGLLMSATATPPNQPIYQDDPAIIAAYNEAHPGQILVSRDGRTYYIGNDNQEIVNPLLLAEISNDNQSADKIVGSFFLESELMKGLKFRTSYDIDLAFMGYTRAVPAYYISVTQNNELSSISTGKDRAFGYNWENTLSFTQKLKKHNISVLVQEVKWYRLRTLNLPCSSSPAI